MSRLTLEEPLEEPIEVTPEELEKILKVMFPEEICTTEQSPIDDPDIEQVWNTPITLI